MKGTQHPKNDVTINPSGNDSILEVISRTSVSRRHFVRTGINTATLAGLGGVTMSGILQTVEAAPIEDSNGFGGIGFENIGADVAPVADAVAVPPGYTVEVLAAWGDPIMPGAPEWLDDATQDAGAQAKQFGMHNDGMTFFPLSWQGRQSSRRGLLCVNHEYTHEQILHGAEGLTGGSGVTIDKARKSQAAHGVAVIDVVRHRGRWKVNRKSLFARRITGNTRMRVSGPAAGHPLLKSKKFDILPTGSVEVGTNDGHTAFGTLNNCADGYTPWGTYLACEENWNGYFAAPTNGAAVGGEFESEKAEIIKDFRRNGISNVDFGYGWHSVDPRFNADANPFEPNLFGWVVEIDPSDPTSAPVKRTALGRFKHESAQMAVSRDRHGVPNRVAFYQGDDERNEYIYKFVCAKPFKRGNRRANQNLLDTGTLYVARFTDSPGSKANTFRGEWVALAPGTRTVIDDPNNPDRKLRLRELASFAAETDAEVQALILIKTRQAADAVGATMMDRPEWIALRSYDQRDTSKRFWDRLDRWSHKDRENDGRDDWDHHDWSCGDDYGDYPEYSRKRPLELYCTLTNNNRRGGGGSTQATSSNNPNGTTVAASARPAVDVANPRPDNDYGHIIRWREDGNVVTAPGFEWDIFVLCGDSITSKTLGGTYVPTDLSGVGYQGNIVDVPNGSADFGAPDGLWFDQFGRLWIQTDQVGDASGDWVNIGANIMACADPNTKEIRRFLTGPRNCEVTGITNTPDGKTMFVGIQHPGEDSPASNPTQFSNWPQSQFDTNSAGDPLPNTPGLSRPRASVLVITREDGGIVGD
ncbi:MAG: twin-arginine translocation pathway signal protein [Acidobacteria bacterium RIFCSPLOWO2_02_FULL_64_15]|nr:MAG: twin-arginine translocation pathway signal protein [Acidobacteria bacterium RIFCSPLOWO2_02_FULL_64_15]